MYLEATRVHVHFFEIPSMAKIDAIEKKQNGGEQVTAAWADGDPRWKADAFATNARIGITIHRNHHDPDDYAYPD